MWTKESYQEHMLGYLYGVETQIEALEQSPSEIRLLYRILDRALDRLWRLIMASDTEWEWFRFALEVSCDDLLDALYRVPQGTQQPKIAGIYRRAQPLYQGAQLQAGGPGMS
jgi:hypothetical protein